MHDIEHLPGIFTLGYLGETNFRTIEIDMNAWLDEIPNGVASVIHIRPGESADQAYMAATTFEDGILKWPITALDLGNYDGYGTMQISLHGMDADNHQIGKSENVRTRVNDSATSMSGDIPDAQQAWMDRMTELIDEQRIQKDKIDTLVDGIARFPVVTYVECGSWHNMLAIWTLASSGQVIPGVTTHDGRSYGLSLTKLDEYEPRDNDLLMVRMTADLKTPYQLTKYYISFVDNESVYDPETGKTYYTDASKSYPIDNMNLHYDSDITLFEKNRVYIFRYHTKQVNGNTQYVYDVLNYTPGLKEAAELAETALTEAQAIIDGNVVRYDRPQSLTYEQKSQFRDNIGAAELLGGKIPASQLPSYVDDVLEYASRSTFPETGETGKIYVALDANLTYRWTGSTYVEISQSLALGETAQTAFPGDRGLAVETEVENRAKVLYAECTEIVTNPAGWRRICVNVPNGYSPKSGDYLAVKFPTTNEIANPPHRYALHYNFHGAVITEDVTVMNLAQDKFDAGTVVFEADSIYLFRHIDEDECQIVGHRVGQALGDTAGTAFPGERGKAVEDAIDGLDDRFDEKADITDVANDKTDLQNAINTKANTTDVEALIKVQDTQPVESANKAWIKETPDEEVQVPTVAEMEAGLAGKINKPAVDGTAGQILRTDGNGNTTWENPATAEEISAATETWLEENITNPSNPPLDRSLSLNTAAAPADMVGDLKSAISANAADGILPFIESDWAFGAYNGTAATASQSDVYTKEFIEVFSPACVFVSSNSNEAKTTQLKIHQYSNGTFLETKTLTVTYKNQTLTALNPNTTHIKFSVYKAGTVSETIFDILPRSLRVYDTNRYASDPQRISLVVREQSAENVQIIGGAWLENDYRLFSAQQVLLTTGTNAYNAALFDITDIAAGDKIYIHAERSNNAANYPIFVYFYDIAGVATGSSVHSAASATDYVATIPAGTRICRVGLFANFNTALTANTVVTFDNVVINRIRQDELATPEMFGAKGDGTTDDTVAITYAMECETVKLDNNYSITTRIDATNAKKIFGNGQIIISNVGGTTYTRKDTETEDDIILYVGLCLKQDVVITGITITTSRDDVIDILAEKSAKMKGVSVSGGRIGLMCTSENYDEIAIAECSFENMFGNLAAAIDIFYAGITEIRGNSISNISNNISYDADGMRVWQQQDNDGYPTVVIAQNTMRNCRGRFIKASAANVVITDNYCYNDANFELIANAIAIDVQKGNSSVLRNQIKNVQNGIHISLRFYGTKHHVADNIIDTGERNFDGAVIDTLHYGETQYNSTVICERNYITSPNAAIITDYGPYTYIFRNIVHHGRSSSPSLGVRGGSTLDTRFEFYDCESDYPYFADFYTNYGPNVYCNRENVRNPTALSFNHIRPRTRYSTKIEDFSDEYILAESIDLPGNSRIVAVYAVDKVGYYTASGVKLLGT